MEGLCRLKHNQLTDRKVGVRLVNLHRNRHSEQERIGLADELEDFILAGFAKDDELLVADRGGI